MATLSFECNSYIRVVWENRDCCHIKTVTGCLANMLVELQRTQSELQGIENRRKQFSTFYANFHPLQTRNVTYMGHYTLEKLSEIPGIKFNDILRYLMDLVPQISIASYLISCMVESKMSHLKPN